MLNYLIFNPTTTMLFTDLNMNTKNISNVGKLSYALGVSTDFIKADGMLD